MVKYFTIALLLSTYPLMALDITTRVSKNPVAIGEPFDLILEVQADNNQGLIPELPKTISPFLLVNTHTSTQISMSYSTQGGTSKVIKNQFIYTLVSNKAGIWTIDPITEQTNGVSKKTKPIQVEVSAKLKKPPTNKSPSNLFDMFQDAFDHRSFFSIPRVRDPLDKSTFQLKTEPKDRKVYIGEMLPVNWMFWILPFPLK